MENVPSPMVLLLSPISRGSFPISHKARFISHLPSLPPAVLLPRSIRPAEEACQTRPRPDLPHPRLHCVREAEYFTFRRRLEPGQVVRPHPGTDGTQRQRDRFTAVPHPGTDGTRDRVTGTQRYHQTREQTGLATEGQDTAVPPNPGTDGTQRQRDGGEEAARTQGERGERGMEGEGGRGSKE